MPLAPGSVFADDYKVIRSLSAAVYVVEQVSTGATRVLKLLDPNLVSDPAHRRRFEKEMLAGMQIESDYVVVVVGAGVDDANEAPWVAMEQLEGEDLGAALAARGALPLDEARPIFAAVADAVGAAHNVGIVHGDLRPQNVFLSKRIKVMGFGTARLAAEAGLEPKGPPLFMAPEQLGDGALTPQSDVWSFGLVVFQVLTGKSYWLAANAARVSQATLLLEITEEPLEAAGARASKVGGNAALPGELDAWFAKCVARAAGDRFADLNEAYAALKKTLASPAAAPPVRKKAPSFGQGTMVMADAPKLPPETAPEPPAPAPPVVEAAPAPGPAKRPVFKTERTMTLGADIAPGFSAEEIIERDLGRKIDMGKAIATPAPGFAPAGAAAGDRVDPNISPADLAAPPPPTIPLPKSRAAAASNAPKSGAGIWVTLVAVAVLAGGGWFAYKQLTSTTPGGAPPEDSARRAAAAEADAKRRDDEAKRAAAAQSAAAAEKATQREDAKKQAGQSAAQRASMAAFDGVTFPMGSTTGNPDEKPVHDVTLAPFSLDAHEVTVEEYAACVAAAACSAANGGALCNGGSDRSTHPINCVDWDQAKAYCEWRGDRLPSEAEWEEAATGAKKGVSPGRRYPWGEAQPDKQLCWERCDTGTCPVAQLAAGDTPPPRKLSDMAGNVAEWTSDVYCTSYENKSCADDARVVRGGAWCRSTAADVRGTARETLRKSTWSDRVGFRCARAK